MDSNIKKYQGAFLVFTIAQFFMMLSLFEYGSSIKALSEFMVLFALFQGVALIMMIIATAKLYNFNKNFFYSLITTIVCSLISLLGTVAKESTEDMTVAWSRGLDVSSDILLCIAYAYFFLGAKEQFNNYGLERNVKRSRLGFFSVIGLTIVINLMSFIGSFNGMKTNVLVAAIFRYGSLAMKFFMYSFMFIVLILMMVYLKKNYKEEEAHEEQ